MTIALGFHASDGIVLCTDSQATKAGGLKFTIPKIYIVDDSSEVEQWNITFAFAGNADLMAVVQREMWERMVGPAREDWGYWEQAVRENLEAILQEIQKKHGKQSGIELLCGTSGNKHPMVLFRARGTVVSEATRDCLGVGDSSVIQYIAGLTSKCNLDIRQALLLGCYMVKQAGKFIDGCDGNTQAAVIRRSGHVQKFTNEFDDDLSALAEVSEKNFLKELSRFAGGISI